LRRKRIWGQFEHVEFDINMEHPVEIVNNSRKQGRRDRVKISSVISMERKERTFRRKSWGTAFQRVREEKQEPKADSNLHIFYIRILDRISVP
jgi:hypothetical protein